MNKGGRDGEGSKVRSRGRLKKDRQSKKLTTGGGVDKGKRKKKR